MKHSFLIILLTLLGFTSIAQPFQGNVRILNNTDCEIYWDVIAVCPGPPCTEYSTQTMNLLPSFGDVTYTYGSYPWFDGEDPICQNWSWAYAIVTLAGPNSTCDGGGGGATQFVGFSGLVAPCDGSIYSSGSTFSCTCNGKVVKINMSFDPSGNVLVNVFY